VVKANYTFMVADDRVLAPGKLVLAPGKLVVGAGLARTRGVAPGNHISFHAYSGKLFTFGIADILPARSELVRADLVLLSKADYRAFFDIPPGHCTDITLRVANPLEVRSVASKLAQQFPDSRPILREEILRTYESIFSWREGIVLALATLAFAILAWEKASGLSADERREIGILKAIDWETGDVLRMKFWEGALLSLSAFLIGYLAAYVHVLHFAASLLARVLKGWAVLYPRFELGPVIDDLQVTTLFVFTVFPYAAATLVPIWRVAITDPDAVMRG